MRTNLARAWVRAALIASWLLATSATAQGTPSTAGDEARAQALVDAVVRVRSTAIADARSNETLGRERAGSGVVIDERGHVLTIGYLVIEAQSVQLTTSANRTVPAKVAGYDHTTGFAVLEALAPMNVKPIVLGASARVRERDAVMTLPFGGREAAQMARVLSKRPFSGSWEYRLDEALYTSPPTMDWAGAALISRDLQLVGIGSLLTRDAGGDSEMTPGNVFVPIDILKPILSDLIARGRRAGPARPWLGLATEEFRGHLVVTRVSRDGPAEQAGVQPGDLVVALADSVVNTHAQLYQRLWNLGAAGVDVPLRVMRGQRLLEVTIKSIERTAYFRDPVRQ